MNQLNGFISDRLPKTFQTNPKIENLPRQIQNDPYRANSQPLNINKHRHKQQGLALKTINRQIPKKDYSQILNQNKLLKQNITIKNQSNKCQKLRNIINNHLFQNNIRKKFESNINLKQDHKLIPTQNRYQNILKQFYGSPVSKSKCKNNKQNQNKKSMTEQKVKKQKSLLKRSQSSNKQLQRYKSEKKLQIGSHQKMQYFKLNRGCSYKQMYLNKKRLFL